MKWKTKEGKVIELSEMTDVHIDNSIKYCSRRGDHTSVELLKEELDRRWMNKTDKCKYCGEIMYRCNVTCNCDCEVGFGLTTYAFVCYNCRARGPEHNKFN